MTGPTRTAPRAVPGSVVHDARRSQVVSAAIAVIAELGIADASVVKIVQRAGVSRGVVAYHFRDIEDVHDAVVSEVYRVGAEQLGPPVAAAPSPRDALLTFVGGSVEFYAEYPQHLAALHEIFTARRRSATKSRRQTSQHGRELDDVATLLQAGQQIGQFRSFDVTLLAEFIRGLLDRVLPRVLAGDADLTGLRAEVIRSVSAMVDRENDS